MNQVGDSNTEGFNGDTGALTGGYRVTTWSRTHAGAFGARQADEIGTRTTGPSGIGTHDGISGQTALALQSILPGNLSALGVDSTWVVVLMIGSNDIVTQTAATTETRVLVNVDDIVATGATCWVMAIPFRSGVGTKWSDLNTLLAASVAGHGGVFKDWSPVAGDTGADGTHLTTAGAAKLGDYIADELALIV